jgi:hypothetical protein
MRTLIKQSIRHMPVLDLGRMQLLQCSKFCFSVVVFSTTSEDACFVSSAAAAAAAAAYNCIVNHIISIC